MIDAELTHLLTALMTKSSHVLLDGNKCIIDGTVLEYTDQGWITSTLAPSSPSTPTRQRQQPQRRQQRQRQQRQQQQRQQQQRQQQQRQRQQLQQRLQQRQQPRRRPKPRSRQTELRLQLRKYFQQVLRAPDVERNEELPKLPREDYEFDEIVRLFDSTYQKFEAALNSGNHKEKNTALFMNGLILDEIARNHNRVRGIGNKCSTAYKRGARKYYQFVREFGNVKALNEPCSHYAFSTVTEEIFQELLEEMHGGNMSIKEEGGREDYDSSAEEGETEGEIEDDEDDSSVDMLLHDDY
ncbi:5905_t:CDS:2 [Paraglomus occultum]|uniref:5905_t:CDS:1 n=1 Tax=Paraglomus occultum TaxID=144539 RepID=A0A9N9APL2_9GLOM|nr:5905_t:CDS:2 [Paraglomus occultum]